MKIHHNRVDPGCPPTSDSVAQDARQQVEKTLAFCRRSDLAFLKFERCLILRLAVLGCVLVRLFLTARHERLDLSPYLKDGVYRVNDDYAERTVKTAHGPVRYGRAQLSKRNGKGDSFYPLDAELGLTRDRLSPWVMQWVARLATRMSFASARLICKAALGWSPATETIEQVVLGLGRQAAPFMQQRQVVANEDDVLLIEIDGKCAPTATDEELRKRRGKRRHREDCSCGCQRHRGKAKRKTQGSKKRRKKGDKSKNGKEAVVVVMYTLKRGAEGKLHGPHNKKVWASFAGRKAAARWARAEATRRGFGPDTKKTIQIVMDGALGLKQNLERLFPNAILTLDSCHAVEKLWDLGHHFHAEGSEALKVWVEDLKTLLYAGRAEELIERLRAYARQVPLHGPGTKSRREALRTTINYLARRVSMMRYGEWREQDLVLASGQVEGAVRHVVGERLDCGGMRWVRGKAELLLHLRCIELNGDWREFIEWAQQRNLERLHKRKRVKTLTDKAVKLAKAA